MALRRRGYGRQSGKAFHVVHENGTVYAMSEDAYKRFLKARSRDRFAMPEWNREPGVKATSMSEPKAQRYYGAISPYHWTEMDYSQELSRITRGVDW